MQEKTFNRILSAVGIIVIPAFFASLLYQILKGAILSLKDFAVVWLFIYLFAVTLGFKGNLSAHKSNLNRFAIEWVITCMVGLLPTVILIIYG
nr:hypothetical protein [Candidatus Njordarchaeota archaeon]